MKRILVLLAVLALMLSLFAGCGRYGEADDGTNVSTTDNGTVVGLSGLTTSGGALDVEMQGLGSVASAQQSVDELRAGPFTVIWKMIHSTRFDSKRCKAENPQIYNLYAVSSSYRKFSVV